MISFPTSMDLLSLLPIVTAEAELVLLSYGVVVGIQAKLAGLLHGSTSSV
jgi:hypothetical protein